MMVIVATIGVMVAATTRDTVAMTVAMARDTDMVATAKGMVAMAMVAMDMQDTTSAMPTSYMVCASLCRNSFYDILCNFIVA